MTCLVRKQNASRKWISNFLSTCLAETDFLLYNYFLGTYRIWYPGNSMPLKSSCKSVVLFYLFFFFPLDFSGATKTPSTSLKLP